VAPVIDSVERQLGQCTRGEYSAVASELETFLAGSENDTAVIELTRVRYRALLYAGSDTEQRLAFTLAADWVGAGKQLYHRREYELAERMERLALEARPGNLDARAFLVRSLIKQGKLSDARDEIGLMRRQGDPQEAAFLEGFLERHRSHFAEALAAYTAARQMGRRGLALDRELANCYVELGEFELAKQHIEAALHRQADNAYVVALRIRIACYQNDEATARDLLRVLREVDDEAFYEYHRSRVELYFGHPEDVHAAAVAAVAASKQRPSFEIEAQLVLSLILLGLTDAAQDELRKLRQMYPHRSHDVQTGLSCRMLIVSRRYDDALAVWDQLEDKGRPVHLKLRRDALRGLLEYTNLGRARKQAVEAEIATLDERLGKLAVGVGRDLIAGLADDE
jgi:tetratricopeptide (TPR) repeat protein